MRSPREIYFPFLPQFPTLAAVMDVSIPCRPSSLECVAPCCAAPGATRQSVNGRKIRISR